MLANHVPDLGDQPEPFNYPCNRTEWAHFIGRMQSGNPVEITVEMRDYWLGVLPPVRMGYDALLPDNTTVRADFGFAEGEENVVAFYRAGGRHFCCQTEEINRG